MFEVVDRHGFGERCNIKPIRKEKIKYITLRFVPDEDSEEVKRIKKKWKEMKENRIIKSV